MLALCKFIPGVKLFGNTVFDAITSLANAIIPVSELTDELMADIYAKRAAVTEADDDVSELLSLEYIMEAFDDHDRKALLPEFKSAKEIKAEHNSFRARVASWKVSAAAKLKSIY